MFIIVYYLLFFSLHQDALQVIEFGFFYGYNSVVFSVIFLQVYFQYVFSFLELGYVEIKLWFGCALMICINDVVCHVFDLCHRLWED